MSAWDRFFCACCQTERPLSEKVKYGGAFSVRCQACVSRATGGKRGRGRPAKAVYEDDPPDYSVPTEVVEAWRESVGEW